MNKNITIFLLAITTTFLSAEGQEKLQEVLGIHVSILASDSLSGRGFGFPEKKLAVDYITRQFALSGFTAATPGFIEDFLHFEGQTLIEGKNIIGIIEGTDPVLKNEYIVLGAHYDHLGWKPVKNIKTVYNGADDNASGVASIIETGRILQARKNDLKRSIIIVAFDGEEAGLIGSSAFIKGPAGDTLNIRAMFSLDMVGMLSKNKGVDLNGFNSLKNGEDLVAKIAKKQEIPVRKTEKGIEMWTDTWSFGKKSIPSFYITTGLLSPYHKPEDDSDLLDYEGMAKIVNLMSEIVLEMANTQNLVPDKQVITHSVNPGVMTGATLSAGSSFFTFRDKFYNARSVFALQAGITSKIRLSHILSLQPALTYEMTGSNTEQGKIYLHSFSPQLDLMLSTPAGDLEKPVFFGFAGGYYRSKFAATGKAGNNTEASYSDDYGINAGVGQRYIKTEIRICLKWGLKDIDASGVIGKTLTRGGYFTYTKYF